MTFHSGTRLRALKSKALGLRLRTRNELDHLVAQHRTLIDVLEPRLLFSADHPLGLSISVDDLQDSDRLLEEAEIASDTSDMLGVFRRDAADALNANSDEVRILSDDAQIMLSDANGVALGGDSSPAALIVEVTTIEDVVDAPNLTTLEALLQNKGVDGAVSLREAITVANNPDNNVGEIRIVLDEALSDEAIRLSLENDLTVSGILIEAGDLDLSGNYVIRGEGQQATIIEQSLGGNRIFELHSGSVTFEDLTIRNGLVGEGENGGGVYVHADANAIFQKVTFENNDAADTGGAIFLSSDTDSDDVDLSLNDVTIFGSDARRGAGIFAQPDTSIVINGSTFRLNNVSDDGGAIVTEGRLEMYDSVLENNTAVTESVSDNARGGAIFIDFNAEAIIKDTVFRNNSATSDGGAISSHGDVTLINSGLIENSADRRGGGLYNNGTSTLDRVTAWGNKVDAEDIVSEGGAIFSTSLGNLNMSYSIVADNYSDDYSAGVGLEGDADIRDSIIVDNRLPAQLFAGAAGLAYTPATEDNLATITNTVIANNIHGIAVSDLHSYRATKVVSNGFNLVESIYGFGLESTSTDHLSQDPGDFTVDLVDNRWARVTIGTVDEATGEPIGNITVNNGNTDGVGNLTLNGAIVGDTPNIGGYENDQLAGIVFWSDDGGNDSAIYRSDDSFFFSQKIIEGIDTPLDIEINNVDQRVVWLDKDNHSIKSAKYDGTDIRTERLVDDKAIAFALDVPNARIFIATNGSSPQLLQYSLNDTFSVDQGRDGVLIKDLAGEPADVELDQNSDRLYWSERVDNSDVSVWSLDTSGVDLSVAVSENIANKPAVKDPYALTVNDDGDEVYWSEPALHRVVRYQEASETSTKGKIENSVDLGALVYDSVNERLIIAGNNKDMYWVDSEFGYYVQMSDSPEKVKRMAYVRSDEPAFDPIFYSNPVFSIIEGGVLPFDNSILGVVDQDTADTDVVFSVVSDVEVGVYISGVKQTAFTLADLKTPDLVELRHSGVEPSVVASLQLTVSDEQVILTMPSIQFEVSAVNDNAPVAITHEATVKHGTVINTVAGGETSLLFGMTDEDVGAMETYEVVFSNVTSGASVVYSSEDDTFEYQPPDVPVDVDFEDSFNYQIKDNAGNISNVAEVKIVVIALDAPTIVESSGNADAFETKLFSMNLNDSFAFSSSENATPQTWSVTYADGSEAENGIYDWITFDQNSAVLTGTPQDGNTGMLSLAVVVTDSNGLSSDPLTFDILVRDTNQVPVINSSNVMSIDENLQDEIIGIVSAEDPDAGDELAYYIYGGVDSHLFVIDENTGELAFKTAKNFEVPIDEDNNNNYQVTVGVDDGYVANDSAVLQEITVSVEDANDNPVVITDRVISITENIEFIIDIESVDEDGSSRSYSIVGGSDAALFSIDALSGKLYFVSAPEYDAPVDFDGGNDYEVTVQVADSAGGSSTQSISVSVVSEQAPTNLVSISQDNANELEEYILVLPNEFVFQSADDATPFVWNVTQATPGEASGALPDLHWLSFDQGSATLSGTPSDADTGILSLKISVTDTNELTSVAMSLDIDVEDINQKPEIVSDFFTVVENARNGIVGNILANDPDSKDVLRYSLADVDDAALFTIDEFSGELSFLTTPNYEMPLDEGKDNTYEIDVMVDDNVSGLDRKKIIVVVEDINEAPALDASVNVIIEENKTDVHIVSASDEDAEDNLQFSIVDDKYDGGEFSINPVTGNLTFNVAPDYEAPENLGGDREYKVKVQVNDNNNGVSTQVVLVKISDGNDAPVMSNDVSIDIKENTTEVLLVSASDADGHALSYSIVSGDDSDQFTIDNVTGRLAFDTAPDFEAPENDSGDREYNITVKADDGNGKSATQDVKVKVLNVNEAPVIEAEISLDIPENTSFVTTASAIDVDGDLLSYSIDDKDDGELFTIDATSGELSFRAAPDFEAMNNDGGERIYSASIRVTDEGGKSGAQIVRVQVTNVNESPVVLKEVRVVAEENKRDVLSVLAIDIDGDELIYSIKNGDDSAYFSIDDRSGELTFNIAPDYEALENAGGDRVYQIFVEVNDGNGGSASQKVLVSVDDVNEAPLVQPNVGVDVEENSTNVSKISASDVEGDILTYSISGGDDGELFSIDEVSGMLTLVAPLDFEAPENALGDREYHVIIRVQDSGETSSTQNVFVKITDTNDAPAVESDITVTPEENQKIVTTVSASDADKDKLTYSIEGGDDAGLFHIDSTTGQISFISAPDFENPVDADGIGMYDVIVQVSDGNNGVSEQSIVVDVKNINDAPVVKTLMSDQLLDKESSVDVSGDYFEDQDGDNLSFSMTDQYGGALPEWIDFDTATAELRLGVIPSEAQSETVSLQADDRQGGVVQMSFGVRFFPEVESIEPVLQAAEPILQAAEPVLQAAEPILQAAEPVLLPVPSFEENSFSSFDNINEAELGSLSNTNDTTISKSGFSASLEARKLADTVEPIASVSLNTISTLLANGFADIEDQNDSDRSQRAVLRDNVISEFLAGQADNREIESNTYIRINIFEDSVNIANLFSAAQQQDAEMFATLSDHFKKQEAEFESQARAARGVAGSAISMTSGLSVGYFLYLLRGGAIMSSMLTSLPAWRFVDPLPILGTLEGSLDGDEESLQSIIGNSVEKK